MGLYTVENPLAKLLEKVRFIRCYQIYIDIMYIHLCTSFINCVKRYNCATLKLYLKHDYSIVFLRDKFISFSPNQPTCHLLFYKPPYLLVWCVFMLCIDLSALARIYNLCLYRAKFININTQPIRLYVRLKMTNN